MFSSRSQVQATIVIGVIITITIVMPGLRGRLHGSGAFRARGKRRVLKDVIILFADIRTIPLLLRLPSVTTSTISTA